MVNETFLTQNKHALLVTREQFQSFSPVNGHSLTGFAGTSILHSNDWRHHEHAETLGCLDSCSGLALAGCSDSEDTVTEEPALEEPELEEEEVVIPDDMALGNAGLKKLTRSQYVNSLRDVIGEELKSPTENPMLNRGWWPLAHS